jgi:hypothetical protein
MKTKNTNGTITYFLSSRTLSDLLSKSIFMDFFTTAKPNTSGLVGFAELRITPHTDEDNKDPYGSNNIDIVIPSCPVYRDRSGPRIRLPQVSGEDSGSFFDPPSQEELQAAFRKECDVFIQECPELKPLLGPGDDGEKEAA